MGIVNYSLALTNLVAGIILIAHIFIMVKSMKVLKN